MANVLKPEKQLAVLNALTEGMSVRSTERLTGVHRDTIIRFMGRVGDGCQRLMDRELRNLTCPRIECDEIWAYVGKKQRHLSPTDDEMAVGDFYTFVALDPITKLVPSFHVGKRDVGNTRIFINDLASRLSGRVQLSTDSMAAYTAAIDEAFGSNVDYGQIVKFYEREYTGPGRYSPPVCIGTERTAVWGNPDPAFICTSHVERSNLSMRMGLRRMTRLTNAFSRRVENLQAAVRVYFAHYNFVRVHKSLRITPAMASGVTPTLWSMSDLLGAALG
jgi:IS1 family transposase